VEYEVDADAASDALLAVLTPRPAPAKPEPAKPRRENPDAEDSTAA
jgi:hypothetical protein